MRRGRGLKLVLELLFGGDIVIALLSLHFALAGDFVEFKPFTSFFLINSLSR